MNIDLEKKTSIQSRMISNENEKHTQAFARFKHSI